jgi:hypothetical protein
MRTREPVVPHWLAILVMFLVMVVANVLANGLGRPSIWKLALALATIGAFVGLAVARVRRYRRLDEMHQRIELESLALAFASSFLMFVAYWLLQLTGLLPVLDGQYYVLITFAMLNLGRDGAWRRLARRGESA